ncbi:MAG: alkaline phosphatase family protein [Desulfobulbaceae bacterium]|nr:alkaline phosphatase family protein [Desulfobulbaceae bacterium]
MLIPDYNNSILNLVSAITLRPDTSASEYEPLPHFRDMRLNNSCVVLLIIDGLGDKYLQSRPGSFLHHHRRGKLSSVFPPTTATAVTSFFTGVAPQQHAITGWHTYFKELGAVGTILPFIPRYRGPCFTEANISPAQLVQHDSLLSTLNIPSHVVLPHQFSDSTYSQTLSEGATRHGYENPAEMFELIRQLVNPQHPGLIIAYWPGLDSLAHTHGMDSPETNAHFIDLDKGCRNSLAPLAEQGVTIVITADHGLIDTCEERIIHLEDHPKLSSLLTLPLCGEPRCAFCYVRSDSGKVFERYIKENLKFACQLRKSEELIREGYFGKGTASSRLRERVGEYTLLMKENYIIKDRLLNENPFNLIGVHGGLSAEELYVPLIILK